MVKQQKGEGTMSCGCDTCKYRFVKGNEYLCSHNNMHIPRVYYLHGWCNHYQREKKQLDNG